MAVELAVSLSPNVPLSAFSGYSRPSIVLGALALFHFGRKHPVDWISTVGRHSLALYAVHPVVQGIAGPLAAILASAAALGASLWREHIMLAKRIAAKRAC